MRKHTGGLWGNSSVVIYSGQREKVDSEQQCLVPLFLGRLASHNIVSAGRHCWRHRASLARRQVSLWSLTTARASVGPNNIITAIVIYVIIIIACC